MPEWWTVAELATHYRMSKRTLHHLIATGRLRAFKLGVRKVSDADRRRWERSQEERPAATTEPETPPRASPPSADVAALIAKHLGR